MVDTGAMLAYQQNMVPYDLSKNSQEKKFGAKSYWDTHFQKRNLWILSLGKVVAGTI